MFTRHISRQLAAYADGALPRPEAERTEAHLSECARCEAAYEQVRRGISALDELPLVEAPDTIWASIDAALAKQQDPPRWRWRWMLAAAALALAASAMVYWRTTLTDVSMDGQRIASGKWIETDAKSRALLTLGKIGSVNMSPGTRLRIVTAKPGEHRLALERGEIEAKISAPPKLFFVDTPSGTAVDLGCEYTLHTDENGAGLLRVTKGWVSFDWQGMESLVPAGASCRTIPKAGPGVPSFDDAPEAMKQALEVLGFQKSIDDTLGILLSQARTRDTLTLWHLLSRVSGPDRERVFNRMVALTPLPQGVTREKALQLDPQTLEHWREELAWTW